MAWDNDGAADDLIRREAALRGISETLLRMMRACPTSLIQDVVADHVGKPSPLTPSSMSVTPKDHAVERGTGWQKERPLRAPEGVDLIDRMCANADALERIQTAHERAKVTLDLRAYQVQQEQEREARRRDHELDPFDTGLYKTKDQLDKGE